MIDRLANLLWLARRRAFGVEVWTRRDVGGHAVGCDFRPWEIAQDRRTLSCVCYASVWRRRWPR